MKLHKVPKVMITSNMEGYTVVIYKWILITIRIIVMDK